MIVGVVNADREATVRLITGSPNGQDQEVAAIIDTGFTGFLTLPPALVASLGLPWLGREEGVLSNGSLQVFDVYAATVIWDGQPRIVATDAADTEPLIGMGLLYGHDLRIHVVEAGIAMIEPLR